MARVKSKKFVGIYINKLKNGDLTYYINYKDSDNKLKWEKIGKKSEGITQEFCNQKRIEALNKVRLGNNSGVTNRRKKKNITTLQNIADKYFEYISDRKDLKNMMSRYSLHLKEPFGSKDIHLISLAAFKKLKNQKSKTLSKKTVNHILQLLKTILYYGINHENLKIDFPLREVPFFKIDNSRERYLSKDEIILLLKTIGDNEILSLFVRLSLSTGARVASIMAIRKKDINLSDRTVILKDFKNDSSYTGFLSAELASYLKIAIDPLNPNDNLFKYSPRFIQSRLKLIFDELFNKNLDAKDSKNRVVTHTLRHTFASHLAINGTPIYTIQKLMNHKTLTMTMRYAKLAPDAGRIMIEGLYK